MKRENCQTGSTYILVPGFLILSSIFCFSACVLTANAQGISEQQNKDMVYQKVDKMPLFNGKDAGEFTKWVVKEIIYPSEAIKRKIIGCVTITFVVEKDGAVSAVKVLKGVPTLDEESVRVVKSSPKWTPGMNNNKPVRVAFTIPVMFQTTFPSDAKLKL